MKKPQTWYPILGETLGLTTILTKVCSDNKMEEDTCIVFITSGFLTENTYVTRHIDK